VTDIELLLHVVSRFVHILSAILLLGGAFYANRVLTPVLNILPEDQRMQAAAGAQLRFRSVLFTLVVLNLASGVYNYLLTPHSKQFHIAFGIKMLAVLHIYATTVLLATSPYGDVEFAGKRKRRMGSIAIAGIIVVLISAYLRSLTLP
jgi:uncharacterized membrane protein